MTGSDVILVPDDDTRTCLTPQADPRTCKGEPTGVAGATR